MGLDHPGNTNPLAAVTNLGLKVFQIPKNAKAPRIEKFWECATSDPHFSLEHNNAAVSTTGGVVVFDFDYKPDKGIDGRVILAGWDALGLIPPTLRVSTPGSGVHVYFKVPAGELWRNAQSVLPGVDIRAHHGFVVAPGSTIDGVPYTVVEEARQLADLPPELRQYMTRASEREADAREPATELDQPHMLDRALAWLAEKAPTAVQGDAGDFTTLKVALRLRDMGLSEQSALDAMLDYWNLSKAIPPWEPGDLARKVANAYAYAEHPAGAHDATAEFTPVPNAEAIMAGAPSPETIAARESIIDGAAAPMAAPFQTWRPIDFSTIPKRDILYGNHYIRKFASATVAPGGLGKSALALAEAIAMATGKDILGRPVKHRHKVVYFNAEDPLDEIQRRVAGLCLHYGIAQHELTDHLYLASGRSDEILLAVGEKGEINERAFEMLHTFARENEIDVFVFDPLANMTTSDETNEVFRKLGRQLSLMADACNCAIEVVHHTRKLNGNDATVEDGRGGSALIAAVRSARALNRMTKEEAAKAMLDSASGHFKIDPSGGKNNLTVAGDKAEWYARKGVRLPNGDSIVVVEPWEWPDAMDGVEGGAVGQIFALVGEREREGRPYRADSRATGWVGAAIADVLGLDMDDAGERERAKQVLKTLLETGVLAHDEQEDRKQGRFVKVVVQGEMGAQET